MVREIGKTNSLFNQFLSELRDKEIQCDSMRFRRNMERAGEIFAYEISKEMDYKDEDIITSLGTAPMKILADKPVLATILRAGLPLHQGLLNYFDTADSAFVSAYRKYRKNKSFIIKMDYMSSTSLLNKVLIISDPMLATGGSMTTSIKALLENGKPKHIHVVCLVAGEEGIAVIKRNFSLQNLTIWVGAIDDELTAKAYIVPGLGDAGDLAFGTKLE
ncbi:MAG: uracil phosphoribosyltransferase [Bacteroidetes bacterium]|nr:uracil phosphoribosyltransferase [Bacteroidota bacterium]MBL6943068.1 uracil phosphoribosyltransferase [Bacteroidales bacterium]